MTKKVTNLPKKEYDPSQFVWYKNEPSNNAPKKEIREEKRGSGIWWWLIWLIVMAFVKTATKSITGSTRKTNTPTYTYNSSYNNYR